MGMFKRAPALAVLGALLPGVALAQTTQTATIGQTINGEISESDAISSRGNRYDEYAIRLPSNQALQVTMTSGFSRAYVSIGRQTPLGYVLLQASFGPGQATVQFVSPTDGDYIIRAVGDARGLGDYTLRLDAAEIRINLPEPIDASGPVEGRLSDANGQRDDNSTLYRDYVLRGAPNSRWAATLQSQDFDASLDTGPYVDGRLYVERSETSSAGDAGARLAVILNADGEAVIRARALFSGQQGAYTLSVEPLPPPGPEPEPVVLRIGRPVESELTMRDAMVTEYTEAGESFVGLRPYRYYEIEGDRGDVLVLTAASSEFDTVLEVGARTPAGFAAAVGNDDWVDNQGVTDNRLANLTDSRVVVRFVRSGVLIVRLSSYGEGGHGRFTLSAARAEE